jgi:hypothetical protein
VVRELSARIPSQVRPANTAPRAQHRRFDQATRNAQAGAQGFLRETSCRDDHHGSGAGSSPFGFQVADVPIAALPSYAPRSYRRMNRSTSMQLSRARSAASRPDPAATHRSSGGRSKRTVRCASARAYEIVDCGHVGRARLSGGHGQI